MRVLLPSFSGLLTLALLGSVASLNADVALSTTGPISSISNEKVHVKITLTGDASLTYHAPTYSSKEFWRSKSKPNDPPHFVDWLSDDGCWVGLFLASADTGPYTGKVIDKMDVPLLKTVPVRWFDFPGTCRPGATFETAFSMDSKVREDYFVAVFEGGYSSPVEIGRSQKIIISDKHSPGHVHLTRYQSTDKVLVSFNSAFPVQQYVQFGSLPGLYKSTVPCSATAAPQRSDFQDVPANSSGYVDLGYTHRADITIPPSSSPVYYRVGSDSLGWSTESSFKPPLPPSADLPTSVVLLADYGVTYDDGSKYHWLEPDARNNTRHIAAMISEIDLVFTPGDLAYSTGYTSKWDKYSTQIEPIASRVFFQTGKGNHEQDCEHPPSNGDTPVHYLGDDSGGECGLAADFKLKMPTEGSGNEGNGEVTEAEGYYSLDSGAAHFVMLNTEVASNPGTDQYNWLVADLEGVNREVTPWVVVMGHRQMWDAQMGDEYLQEFEHVLLEYKVDVAVWGHVHYGERTCPMYKGLCVTEKDEAGYDGTIHLIVGNGGQGLSEFPAWRDFDEVQIHEWGFSRLDVVNGTHLVIEMYGDSPMEEEAPLRDRHVIVRDFPRV
ncbi:hypothetical protein TrCOL_g2069 [Triparma columacea]|uniref:Purple acid phosphatase n=1 Tax=Triparma columacea TaxID=722753 RepID=A0A9W7L5A4_9STRA|nr:hypothetical protein TrCOL_g2069 [Triparma columacea]